MLDYLSRLSQHESSTIPLALDIKIGRNDLNVVFLEFGVPDDKNDFYNCIRTIGSLTRQRAIWSVWEKFIADPDEDLTFRRFGVKVKS